MPAAEGVEGACDPFPRVSCVDDACVVYQSATRLPEFTILIKHPDSTDISCNLLVKCVPICFALPDMFIHPYHRFPKTYPTLAAATCSVQPPMNGISPVILSRLNSAIHIEAQKLKGQEAVFTVSISIYHFVALMVHSNTRSSTSCKSGLAIISHPLLRTLIRWPHRPGTEPKKRNEFVGPVNLLILRSQPS
jgi:hypothetical protein